MLFQHWQKIYLDLGGRQLETKVIMQPMQSEFFAFQDAGQSPPALDADSAQTVSDARPFDFFFYFYFFEKYGVLSPERCQMFINYNLYN
jgi:hypothetical protein